MLKLLVRYIRLGDSLRNVQPAAPLVDDMADLTRHYRDAFRKSPDHFNSTTELQGFAPVRIEFTALCPTVGLVAVAPHTPQTKPDAQCLLVNGLEGPQDIAAVRAKVAFPARRVAGG